VSEDVNDSRYWSVADELSTSLDGVEQVVVRIIGGEVAVTAGDKASIKVVRESGSEVNVRLHNGVLYAEQPEPHLSILDRILSTISGPRQRCRVTITAPPSCTVEVSAVSAAAVVSGFTSGTWVKTVSGDVTLRDLGTDVVVKTVSGDVEAKSIAASLWLKTVSGDVAVVEGACRRVDAKSVSGDVLLDLDLDSSGDYGISTVSGEVAVRTPEEPSMLVEATSVSGSLVSDFGLHYWSKPGRRHIRRRIGEGGPRLSVRTVSGDVRLFRDVAAA
jgi:DUF4097 and DUF4098 domain-containing protein YvlB